MSEVQKWQKVGEPQMITKSYGIGLGVQLFLNPHNGEESEFSFFTCKDGNAICAITKQGEILLTRQYKQGVDKIVIEVPGGVADGDETPEEIGARELLEETGFCAEKIKNLGWIALNTRKSSSGFHVLVASGCQKVAEPKQDPNEVIEVLKVSPWQAWRMIKDGEITDVTTREALFTAALQRCIPIWFEAVLPGMDCWLD